MDLNTLYRKFRATGKVSTDTRAIQPGSVFFALKGPTYNANAFAAEALEKGASVAVVDDEKYALDDRYFLVDDALLSLQQLARIHRDHLKIPVIGLTGSNGKTTSKELLHAVLSTTFSTSATRGNLNNHIGVPLTVLEIDDSIEIAVVEMGANHVGEIASLCEIANPTHGFITNIGRAHIGTFGGADNILRAKSELYQHLLTHDGKVFINSQNAVLANMSRRFKEPVFYPAAGDFYHCQLLDADPFVRIRTENNSEITTRLTGNYNFENIAVTLCIGKFFGVTDENSARAISGYVPGNMRSQVIEKGSNRIILDAYNANPSSMEAAIRNLAAMTGSKKIAILGDMYELGDEAVNEHRRLGRILMETGIGEVYFCGVLMKSALETYPAAHYFENVSDLVDHLKKHLVNDSTILIKASRGMKLERAVDVF